MKHYINGFKYKIKYKRKAIYSINYEFLKHHHIDILILKFKNMKMKS